MAAHPCTRGPHPMRRTTWEGHRAEELDSSGGSGEASTRKAWRICCDTVWPETDPEA